jgi:hypothetical protein
LGDFVFTIDNNVLSGTAMPKLEGSRRLTEESRCGAEAPAARDDLLLVHACR